MTHELQQETTQKVLDVSCEFVLFELFLFICHIFLFVSMSDVTHPVQLSWILCI
jgi:hypothetical protein